MADKRGLAAELQSSHWRGASWMWDTRNTLAPLAISEVAMIGAHNTATYEITRRSRFGRDGPKPLRSNGALATLTRFFGGFLMPYWSRCQRMTVAEQLQFGVRYLDLRVAPHPTSPTTLYTTHGLLSTRLEDVLRVVEAFVTDPATSNEFVLLDFQHVFLEPSDPGYAVLFQSLLRLRELCVPRPASGERFPTLGELWRGCQRLYVFMGCDFDFDALPFICAREGFLSSPWLNKYTKKDLLVALDAHSLQQQRQGDASKVFLTQAIITPNQETVLSGTFTLGIKPCSVRALAKGANADLIRWYWTHNTAGKALPGTHRNILMLDYPELAGVEVTWDGGSLKGTVVDICVCINALRSLTARSRHEHCSRECEARDGEVDEWSSTHASPRSN